MISKLKDNRVDKMLTSKGIVGGDIYYSTISVWIISLSIIILSGIGVFYLFASTIYGYLLIPYLIISYLLNAYKNNSFALFDDKLIIINPNIPFRKVTIINNSEINLITIDKTKSNWSKLFLDFGENYLLIQTKNKLLKFYCSG
ncbi:MAG: hypothetical protein ACEQSR_04870, partial [Candidatus Methylacidiphilales bacterium]